MLRPTDVFILLLPSPPPHGLAHAVPFCWPSFSGLSQGLRFLLPWPSEHALDSVLFSAPPATSFTGPATPAATQGTSTQILSSLHLSLEFHTHPSSARLPSLTNVCSRQLSHLGSGAIHDPPSTRKEPSCGSCTPRHSSSEARGRLQPTSSPQMSPQSVHFPGSLASVALLRLHC